MSDTETPAGRVVDGGVDLVMRREVMASAMNEAGTMAEPLSRALELPLAIREAIADVLATAQIAADAQRQWDTLERERPAAKDAAIRRLMEQPNPQAKPTKAQRDAGEIPLHSASSAESIVETDPDYAGYLVKQSDAAAWIIRCKAEYEAAKLTARAIVSGSNEAGGVAVLTIYERRMAELVVDAERARERARLLELNAELCRKGHVTREQAERDSQARVGAILGMISGAIMTWRPPEDVPELNDGKVRLPSDWYGIGYAHALIRCHTELRAMAEKRA